jgi:NitT/TauT family transport system substrate-binding protein
MQKLLDASESGRPFPNGLNEAGGARIDPRFGLARALLGPQEFRGNCLLRLRERGLKYVEDWPLTGTGSNPGWAIRAHLLFALSDLLSLAGTMPTASSRHPAGGLRPSISTIVLSKIRTFQTLLLALCVRMFFVTKLPIGISMIEPVLSLDQPATAGRTCALAGISMMSVYNVVRQTCGIFAFVFAVAIATGPAEAQTRIKFSLDFKFEGPSAPFLVAIDKGYFKAEGIDVSIDPSTGSPEPINRVASGSYDMAFGDINALIRYRDQNPSAPPKAVFVVYNKPPYAIIGRKSRGIATPKDLEGKKLGAPTADTAFAQWPIFVHANNIDASKVSVENVGFPVREPMLAAGQVDAITGNSFSSFMNLKDRGVPVDDIIVLVMADYGVSLYGNSILVNPNFATENPEAVKAFLRAFLKGLKDTIRDPSAAVDAVIKRNDAARKDIELERLRMALKDNILTPEVIANGFGGADMERLNQSIDQIALAHPFKSGKPNGADVFDPSFLPSEALRKTK